MYVAITISFNQPMYSVNESAEHIHPVLSISTQSLTDITVEVYNTNNTNVSAFGE